MFGLIVILLMFATLSSIFIGLFYMIRHKNNDEVKSNNMMKVRVGLQALTIFFLFLLYLLYAK
jgi:phosphatidylglycerophosphate synthase